MAGCFRLRGYSGREPIDLDPAAGLATGARIAVGNVRVLTVRVQDGQHVAGNHEQLRELALVQWRRVEPGPTSAGNDSSRLRGLDRDPARRGRELGSFAACEHVGEFLHAVLHPDELVYLARAFLRQLDDQFVARAARAEPAQAIAERLRHRRFIARPDPRQGEAVPALRIGQRRSDAHVVGIVPHGQLDDARIAVDLPQRCAAEADVGAVGAGLRLHRPEAGGDVRVFVGRGAPGLRGRDECSDKNRKNKRPHGRALW